MEAKTLPNGQEANLKIEIMHLITEGKDPFEIINACVDFIARVTNEKNFAEVAKVNIRSIYGIGLGEPVLLQKELDDVLEREKKLKTALENYEIAEEDKKRIDFALNQHRKYAEQIEQRMKEIQEEKEAIKAAEEKEAQKTQRAAAKAEKDALAVAQAQTQATDN